MCGRSTYNLTWAEIFALYQLTLEVQPTNLEPNFNTCPTQTIGTIVPQDGKREAGVDIARPR